MPMHSNRTEPGAAARASPDPAANAEPGSIHEVQWVKQFPLRLKNYTQWMKKFLHDRN